VPWLPVGHGPAWLAQGFPPDAGKGGKGFSAWPSPWWPSGASGWARPGLAGPRLPAGRGAGVARASAPGRRRGGLPGLPAGRGPAWLAQGFPPDAGQGWQGLQRLAVAVVAFRGFRLDAARPGWPKASRRTRGKGGKGFSAWPSPWWPSGAPGWAWPGLAGPRLPAGRVAGVARASAPGRRRGGLLGLPVGRGPARLAQGFPPDAGARGQGLQRLAVAVVAFQGFRLGAARPGCPKTSRRTRGQGWQGLQRLAVAVVAFRGFRLGAARPGWPKASRRTRGKGGKGFSAWPSPWWPSGACDVTPLGMAHNYHKNASFKTRI